MRRASALVLSVLAVLLFAVPAASSLRAESFAPQRGHGAFAKFSLKANNGLSAEVVTTGDTVDLEISGHHQFVGYRVKGEVSERRVVARFGNLGRISVSFRPAGKGFPKFDSDGCPRKAVTVLKGVFVGTIELRGERDYVTIDTPRARGSVRIQRRQECGAQRRLDAKAHSSGAGEEESEVATLEAKAGTRIFRAAGNREPDGSGRALFFGGVLERRGPMQIGRGAIVTAPSAFIFDHAGGTATVQPPSPFSGSATLATRPDGSKSWEGSLSVSLLGVDPVALAGADFQAKLLREFDD
jgi:hypothetical protein